MAVRNARLSNREKSHIPGVCWFLGAFGCRPRTIALFARGQCQAKKPMGRGFKKFTHLDQGTGGGNEIFSRVKLKGGGVSKILIKLNQ